MLLHINTKEYDLLGSMVLKVEDPDFGEFKRRGNRVATLDGGAAVNDFGYSDSDLQFKLRWMPTADEDSAIRRIIRLHPRIRFSAPQGCFEAAIGSYSVVNGSANLIILPLSRLSE